MDFTLWLAIIAGSTHIVAFALYNKQILQGTCVPNAVSWGLWAFLTVLNFTSYGVMSGDLVKSILPTVGSLMCIFTFLYALYNGKFSKVDPWDRAALVIGLISCFVWWWYHSATSANMILQASIAIAFVPTYRGVWKDPSVEKALPWYLWSIAFTLSAFVVLLRWKGQYQDLAYPVICFGLHIAVALMTRRSIATVLARA